MTKSKKKLETAKQKSDRLMREIMYGGPQEDDEEEVMANPAIEHDRDLDEIRDLIGDAAPKSIKGRRMIASDDDHYEPETTNGKSVESQSILHLDQYRRPAHCRMGRDF